MWGMSTMASPPPGNSFAPTQSPSKRLVLALIAVVVVAAVIGGLVAFSLLRGDGSEFDAVAASADSGDDQRSEGPSADKSTSAAQARLVGLCRRRIICPQCPRKPALATPLLWTVVCPWSLGAVTAAAAAALE